ncbi:DUF4198 domain-containing protein [Sphingomonas solaris]|uniref:DUF4198 domain-containing protein n=1 Tax=Alterirhizorhabdus solaris TaxID=2529389 RepID=A0A558R5D4_9SPHN|nr:DUF4198 domain-containing protein [Sphingomonas solaris]TVV74585.1 DUF4198 domain-containing protein [Sphingomonas solaris]
MRPVERLVSALMLAGLVTAAVPADAHGIWFASRAKQPALIYGIGADDLDAVKRQPLVEKISAFDASFQPIPAVLRVSGPVLYVDAESQPTLLAAVLNNGTWSKMKDGEFVKKGRDEAPDAVLSEKTMKYAVGVQGPLTAAIPPLPGQSLQIVPVGAIPEKLGAPLTYKVLFMGKPVAGARLINDMINDPDAKEVATKADGTVTLPVRNQGLNVIRAVYDGPADDRKKVDRIEYTATLSYTLAHAPE